MKKTIDLLEKVVKMGFSRKKGSQRYRRKS